MKEFMTTVKQRICSFLATLRYINALNDASTHMFYPIAIETAGTWDDMAIELVQEIDRRTKRKVKR